jgi:hypothetical protein
MLWLWWRWSARFRDSQHDWRQRVRQGSRVGVGFVCRVGIMSSIRHRFQACQAWRIQLGACWCTERRGRYFTSARKADSWFG